MKLAVSTLWCSPEGVGVGVAAPPLGTGSGIGSSGCAAAGAGETGEDEGRPAVAGEEPELAGAAAVEPLPTAVGCRGANCRSTGAVDEAGPLEEVPMLGGRTLSGGLRLAPVVGKRALLDADGADAGGDGKLSPADSGDAAKTATTKVDRPKRKSFNLRATIA